MLLRSLLDRVFRERPVALAALLGMLVSTQALAITATPFGSLGAGGRIVGQTLTIGPGGVVEEMDAFVGWDGVDLNGAAPGVTARLGVDGPPDDLFVSFRSSISLDGTDLFLTYTIVNRNSAGVAYENFKFFFFLDAEIDEATNTFFNEYAEVTDTAFPGQTWEIDEPGFLFGDKVSNIQLGQLDGTNAIPESAPEDVAMALQFTAPRLEKGVPVWARIRISEDGVTNGGISLTQYDIDPNSTTQITLSGGLFDGKKQPVPEPDLLMLLGLAGLFAAGRSRSPSSQPRA